jgi:hypothetical protein
MPQNKQRTLGALLLLGLSLPAFRELLQAQMHVHMLVQLPALALAGALLAGPNASVPAHRQRVWNAQGITGMCFAFFALTLSMIPRVLDMAVVDPLWNTAKFVAFLMCGFALRHSWRQAGWVLQGFFLGNLLPMMAVVGVIYQEPPLRVCNAYGLGDQQTTGFWMVLSASAVAGVWLWRVMAAQLAFEAETARFSMSAGAIAKD